MCQVVAIVVGLPSCNVMGAGNVTQALRSDLVLAGFPFEAVDRSHDIGNICTIKVGTVIPLRLKGEGIADVLTASPRVSGSGVGAVEALSVESYVFRATHPGDGRVITVVTFRDMSTAEAPPVAEDGNGQSTISIIRVVQ